MSQPIGILGGTFDPIHHGHLAIAEDVRVAMRLERVILIPAAHQPLKNGNHGASPVDRLAMARLASADNDRFEVSAIEIERHGPSYTVDTLHALHARGLTDVRFILGADALADLPRWRGIDAVLQLAQIVAVARPGYPLETRDVCARLPNLAQRLTIHQGPALDISSSELRRRIATGRSIRYLVPDSVAEYITSHGLYAANGAPRIRT